MWRSWLRRCCTRRKVAGSILDGVIGIFHWHNPSGCTMALGSTQPLTEMSTRNISWGLRVTGATFLCRLSWKLRASTSWNLEGLSRHVQGVLYLYFILRYRIYVTSWTLFIVWAAVAFLSKAAQCCVFPQLLIGVSDIICFGQAKFVIEIRNRVAQLV
jgi:hypothetical protein